MFLFYVSHSVQLNAIKVGVAVTQQHIETFGKQNDSTLHFIRTILMRDG